MIINRKFLRERRHSRISRRHLCNSTAAAFRFDVSARLRLLMARRYGVTRPPGPLPPSREERRGGWRTTKSAKAPKLQEDKRMHASSFYGRPMLEPRWRRGREKSEWSERARERERGHTHYLNARHSERRLVRSRSSLVVPTLPSSSCPQSEATRFSPFFSFFSLSPLTPPRLSP